MYSVSKQYHQDLNNKTRLGFRPMYAMNTIMRESKVKEIPALSW